MFFFGNWITIHQLTAERVSYRASLFSSCLELCSICLCHTNRNHDVLARTRCHQWSVSAATTVVYLTVDVESSLFFETKLNTLSERRELASRVGTGWQECVFGTLSARQRYSSLLARQRYSSWLLHRPRARHCRTSSRRKSRADPTMMSCSRSSQSRIIRESCRPAACRLFHVAVAPDCVVFLCTGPPTDTPKA